MIRMNEILYARMIEVLTRAEIAARYKFKQRLRKQMQRERSIMEGARM